MSHPIIIPDASILLAPVLEESETVHRVDLLLERANKDECTIIIPNMCMYEIGNRLMRLQRMKIEDIVLFVNTFSMIHPSSQVIARALHIGRAHNSISFYDTIYHACAIEYDGTFLTADSKYYTKTKKLGHIMHIKDYA